MNLLEIIKIIILGIVEGITEWLPISSTGHMILIDEFLKLDITDAFKEMFFVVIQLGAILAVILVYFKKLNPFALSKTKKEKIATWNIWFKVIVATIPAMIFGLLFDDFLEEHFYNFIVVALMLLVYGIWFIYIEKKQRVFNINNFSELNYKIALLIGCFQVLALIPGTSRSGATIIGAMILGCSRVVSAEFSFFLSIPVMLGASLLKVIKYIFIENLSFSSIEIIYILLGSSVAFLVSLFAIKFLIKFIQNHSFSNFGVYRIVLAIILLAYAVIK